MKRFILLLTLPFFFSLNSCKKEEDARFLMEYDITYEIPAGISNHNVYSQTIEVPTEYAKYFSENSTSAENLESITSNSIQFNSTNDTISLDYLKNVYIFISADGLDEKLLGWQFGNFDDPGKEIEYMIKSGSDFAPYLAKERIFLRFQTEVKTTTPAGMGIQIKPTFLANGIKN